MLRRLPSYLKLILLALALVIIPGALVIMSQSGWAHRRTQEILASQLSKSTKREVSVGPVTGNLLTGITVHGLAIAEKSKLSDGAMATAERVVITYGLMSILRGQLAPAAAMQSVEVYNPRLHVVRLRSGRFNLQDLLPPTRRVPIARRFRGTVRLHDAAVFYEDYSWYVKNAPLQLHIEQAEVAVDARQVTRILVQNSGRVTDGRAKDFKGLVTINTDEPFFDVTGELNGLDVAWGMRTFGLQHGYTVTGGRIDLKGSVYQVPTAGKPAIDFSGTGYLHGVTAVVPDLPYPLRLSGLAWGGLAGFRMQDMTLRFAGSDYAMTGFLGDLRAPIIDTSLVSSRVALGPLARFLPQSMGAASLAAGGPASLTITAIGPPENLDLRVQARVAEGVTVRLPETGTVRASRLSFTADVVGTANPAVRASITGSQVSIPSLKVSSDADSWPKVLSFAPIQPFSATMQWCGGVPVAQGELRVPVLRADDLRMTDLRTHVTLINDFVRLRNLQANVLGGALTADGAVKLQGANRGLRLRGNLRGVDLARLSELPIELPEDLRGTASATFQGQVAGDRITASADLTAINVAGDDMAAESIQGTVAAERRGSWRGVGRLTAQDLVTPELRADSAEALFELQNRLLTLHGASFAGDDGVGWARGEINLADNTLDLQVRGAELSVERLAPLIGLKEVQGVGYASGTVGGTRDAPNFEGRLIVFNPQIGEYELEALAATVRLQGDTLEATQFEASRGSALISGQGTISNLGSPPEQMALRAEVQGQGLRLADVIELAQRDWPADGLAEFSATVSGSVARPQARGEVRVSNAHYDQVPIARAVLPFTLDQGRLTLQKIEAVLLDSPVSGSLTLDLGTPMEVEGYLSAGQVKLEGLAPFFKSQFPIGGSATVRGIWVRGPIDDLQGGAQLVADEVYLGREIIKDVNANISLAKGQVLLQETSFLAAGGRVGLKAGYNYASETPTIDAAVSLQGTSVSDLLYLALPVVQAVDQRPAEQQKATDLALRSYALRLRGALDATVNLTGPVASPTAVADINATNLVLDQRPFPDVQGRGRVTTTGIDEMSLALSQGEALVTVDGGLIFDGPIDASIEGTGINLAQLRPWLTTDIPYGGKLGFTVVASGLTRAPDLTASVDISNPTFAGVVFDVLSVPVATVREGEIDVDTLVIKRGQQEIVVDGQLPFSWSLPAPNGGDSERRPGLIPNGTIALNAQIEQTDLAFFLPLVDEYLRSGREVSTSSAVSDFRWAAIEAAGSVNSSVSVTGTVADPALRGFLRVHDGSLRPMGWRMPLSNLQADITLTGSGRENLLQIKDLSAVYDKTTVDLGGNVYLDYLGMGDFWRNRFNLLVTAAAPSQTLREGLVINDLSGGLSLRTEEGRQVFRSEKFGFGIGGGRMTLTGDASLTNFRLARLANNDFNFEFNLTPGRITYANVVNAMLAGKLQLVTPENSQKAVVRGDFTLSDGTIGLAPAGVAAVPLRAISSRFPSPDLEIQAAIGRNVNFRGSGVNTPLQANPLAMKVSGTPQRPIISGSVMARGGTTNLPTATLRLSHFGVDYTIEPEPGDRNDPVALRLRGRVDGLAETTISRSSDQPIDIDVTISGSLPDQVVIQTSSTPALTETQIYALLGGVPFTQLPGIAGRDQNLTQMVSAQFLATLANAFRLRVFQPIEEELKRLLGLSELGISFAFDQPVSVQVGKYIVRNLLVSYEQPLAGDTDVYDLRVSYQLPGGLRITYHNDERNDQRVEVGYSFTF
ncbi:MAG: hypothetical protein ACYC63_00670 [Armatimonadota bacterium]